MIYGFDLDGTLDKKPLADLANLLLLSGHEVHIITSVFPESGEWQSPQSKREKCRRLGIPVSDIPTRGNAQLHVLWPIPVEQEHDISARLRDLGLQKGHLTEKLGIDVFIDDSEIFCGMIPRMDGNVTVLRVM